MQHGRLIDMNPFAVRCLSLLILSLLLPRGAIAEENHSTTYYVQLIRGSNGPRSHEKNCRAIGPKLSKKLSPVFQWKNYWEVSRKETRLSQGKITRIHLTPEQNLEMEWANDKHLELRLYRNGKLARKTRHQA